MTAPEDSLAFRAETPADDATIREAHVAHRRMLLAGLPWPEPMLATLCEQHHLLLERHLTDRHPAAERRMIVHDGATLGRVCLDRSGTPWRVVDIVLLPAAQARGLGAAAFAGLFTEATAAGAALDLHVGHDNPRAEMFYRRLGFIDGPGATASHRHLIWQPRPVAAPPDRGGAASRISGR